MHTLKIFIQMLGGISTAETNATQARLLIRCIAVVNTRSRAISIFKGIIHTHIIALHIFLNDETLFIRRIQCFFYAVNKFLFVISHSHSDATAVIHGLNHNRILNLIQVLAFHFSIKMILRDTVNSIALTSGLKDILERKHVNDPLSGITRQTEGITNLATVNRLAPTEAVTVDAELIDFLLFAKNIHAVTGGQTNIAMGAVLRLWHNARELGELDPANAKLPDAALLAEAAKHCDITSLIIDEENRTVRFADPLTSLDVGAVGKGYAADKSKTP